MLAQLSHAQGIYTSCNLFVYLLKILISLSDMQHFFVVAFVVSEISLLLLSRPIYGYKMLFYLSVFWP